MIWSHCSGVISSSGSKDSMPALVTRMVDRTELGAHAAKAASTDGPVGDVDLDGRGLSPRPVQLVGRRLGPGAVAVEDGHVVAVGDEPPGDAQPDARRPARSPPPPGSSAGLDRGELEVQVAEAPQHPGRLVVGSGVRRAVRGAPRTAGCRASRSRMRSRLTRPSARASGPPGQVWLPRPKAMWALALGRSTRNSAGHSKRRGSRLAAPFSSITGVPAAIVDPADGGRAAGQAEVGLHRALDAQRLFDEVRDQLRVGPELVLQLRALGQVLQRDGEQAGGGLLPGGEQEGGGAHHGGHVGHGAVGVRGQGQVGEHVVARAARRRSSM